jgi:hypothetical protein
MPSKKKLNCLENKVLYDLVEKRRGKETVVMTDELPKVNDRLRTLRKSLRNGVRGQKVNFSVRQATKTDKFRKPPHDRVW